MRIECKTRATIAATIQFWQKREIWVCGEQPVEAGGDNDVAQATLYQLPKKNYSKLVADAVCISYLEAKVEC